MATSTAAVDKAASIAALNANSSTLTQLLSSLGLTPEDLQHHADQMREFLQSRNASSKFSPSLDTSSRPHSKRAETPKTSPVDENSAQSSSSMPLPLSTSHVRSLSSHPPSDCPSTRTSRPSTSTLSTAFSDAPEPPAGSSSSLRSVSRRSSRSHVASSPGRPKMSLDEVMKMRSQKSRRVSDSEESEESAEEYLRFFVSSSTLHDTRLKDVFSKAPSSTSTRRYRYPHPNGVPQSVPARKTQHNDATPSTRRGNYYRDRDGSLPPLTPTILERRSQAKLSTNKVAAPQAKASPAFQTPTKSYYRERAIPPHVTSSSPTRASSPISSPARAYNVVSSPGMMSDPPDENDSDLPYKLPNGPFSADKPDFSYAALIGQAILASPQHALRLKDIYDYISIVYPFFKRDGHSHGQKWMNAIRQNLTNTPQFFKREHPSGKPSKGALWCIALEDIPCFAEGGYNRHALNPDSVQNAKAEKRKRRKEEKYREEKVKRAKTSDGAAGVMSYRSAAYVTPTYPHFAPVEGVKVQSEFLFPPLPADHPFAHLTNRNSHSPEPAEDEGVIFPPLPAYSSTRLAQEQRANALSNQSSTSSSLKVPTTAYESSNEVESEEECSSPGFVPPSSEASSMSVPDLTPNNSSSSPANEEKREEEDDDDFDYFSEYIESETQSLHEESVETDNEDTTSKVDKGKEKAQPELFTLPDFMRMPQSPTASRRTRSTSSPGPSLFTDSLLSLNDTKPVTPPPKDISSYLSKTPKRNFPETPTRKRNVSHESNGESHDEHTNAFLNFILKTPSRRSGARENGSAMLEPVTPRKFSGQSPFGTGFTPFRTPGGLRSSVFDPTDPSSLLNEELDALASARHRETLGSPGGGLFPRGKGILYESPSLPSPDKWKPW